MLKQATYKLAIVLALFYGCKSYYQETGVSATSGDVSAPLEISDSSDIINVRALFSMSGSKLWAARGNAVYMRYRCIETNEYLNIVNTHMLQESEIVVIPTNSNQDILTKISGQIDCGR